MSWPLQMKIVYVEGVSYHWKLQQHDKHKLIHFLLGLNDTFSTVRTSFLMMHPIPVINFAYLVLFQEESQQIEVRCLTDGVLDKSFPMQLNILDSMLADLMHSLNGEINDFSCTFCMKKKHKQDKCSINSSNSERVFDLIHLDVWEPPRVFSMNGFKYFLTLMDGHKRTTRINLLRCKNEVYSCTKNSSLSYTIWESFQMLFP